MTDQIRPARSTLRFALALALALLMGGLIVPAAVDAAGVNLNFTTAPPNPTTAGANFPVPVHVQDNAAAPLTGVLVTRQS